MVKIINSIEYKLIPIEGNQHYYISDEGYVYSEKSNKLLKYRRSTDGYWNYGLSFRKKLKFVSAHRLVALTYLTINPYKPYVNHKDGNKSNNHFSNLEWVTPSENIKHAYKTGLKSNRGDKHPRKKLTEEIVIILRARFKNEKLKYSDIAKEYNVKATTISKAVRGITFSHI